MSDKSIAFLESITKEKLTISNLIPSIRECEEMSQTEFVRLALQDEIEKSGLHFEVQIKAA